MVISKELVLDSKPSRGNRLHQVEKNQTVSISSTSNNNGRRNNISYQKSEAPSWSSKSEPIDMDKSYSEKSVIVSSWDLTLYNKRNDSRRHRDTARSDYGYDNNDTDASEVD